MNSRRLVSVGLQLSVCLLPVSCSNSPATVKVVREGQIAVRGVGATLPAPLYSKWIEEFEKRNSDIVVTYDAVGSGEGTERFLAGSVDFGASDAALTDAQIRQAPRGVLLIPTAIGTVVLAYNLDDLGGPLRLKRDVYTDIFLGKIKKWNDPRIAETNPGLRLPSTSIHVVARQDESGTTFTFSNHLAAVSEEWKKQKGIGTKIDWSPASLAKGNEGVAGLIKRTPGAIGYVEYGMAKRTGLPMAWLENKSGKFIEPTGGSASVFLAHGKLAKNLRGFFPDPEGEDSYPIVTYTWILLYKDYSNPRRSAAIKRFLEWCLTDGQQFNEGLGFIRLPAPVASSGLDALSQVE